MSGEGERGEGKTDGPSVQVNTWENPKSGPQSHTLLGTFHLSCLRKRREYA